MRLATPLFTLHFQFQALILVVCSIFGRSDSEKNQGNRIKIDDYHPEGDLWVTLGNATN